MPDEAGGVVVAKTGMGSSAALVTSLVGCLALFLGVANLPRAKPAACAAAPGLLVGCERDEAKAVRLVHHVAQVRAAEGAVSRTRVVWCSVGVAWS